MSKRDLPLFLPIIAILTGGLFFIILPYNFFVDNHIPICPFYNLLGVHSPGCGTLRALNAFFHGNFSAAWYHNSLSFLWILIGIIIIVRNSIKLCLQKNSP